MLSHAKEVAATPPRPAVCLRVGTAGHRPNRLPQDYESLEQLKAAALRVFAEIATIAGTAASNAPAGDPSAGQRKAELFVISQLAEGSDRFMAEAGMAQHYTLHCILPFAEDRYLSDFKTPESKELFARLRGRAAVVDEMPVLENEDMDGYHAAGAHMLDHSDVLLAVWDGKPSNGPGGTTWAIDNALRRGMPVVVLPTWAPGEARMAYRGATIRLHPAAECTRCLKESIGDALDLQGTHRYWKERWPRWTMPFSYLFIRLLGTGKWVPLDIGKVGGDCTDVQLEWLKPHFRWLDVLAKHFGEQTRSANLILQVLGTVAILSALGYGVTLPIKESHPSLAPLLVVAEFACLLTMVVVDRLVRKHEWHELWLLYRSLAEQIRCMNYLIPLGMVLQQTPSEEPVVAFGKKYNPHAHFSFGLQRTLARQHGLPVVDRSEASLKDQRRSIQNFLEDQLRYHRKAVERHDRAAAVLVLLKNTAFWVAGLFCAVELIHEVHALESVGLKVVSGLRHVWGFQTLLSKNRFAALKLLTGMLAALGSLGAGLISRSELRRLADRSTAMRMQLERLDNDIKRIVADADTDHKEPTIQHLMEWVSRLSVALMGEVRDWQLLLSGKPPEKE